MGGERCTLVLSAAGGAGGHRARERLSLIKRELLDSVLSLGMGYFTPQLHPGGLGQWCQHTSPVWDGGQGMYSAAPAMPDHGDSSYPAPVLVSKLAV